MPQSNVRILFRFLGSMNLAITLLVAIAIAAVIGTVVQQNQPYPDYLLKFGPFWFEMFKRLDVFNIYSSLWFIGFLGFLVLSTSVCVYRHLPVVLRDVSDFRQQVQRSALLKLPYHAEWSMPQAPQTCQRQVLDVLKQHGYGFRIQTLPDSMLIAAKKGNGGRLGYVFSHLAIIVICLGGLLDGNLPLKIAEWRGRIAVETRRIPASEIPEISTLSDDNLSFRANIDIAERQQANLAFVDYKDGYLLQKLPFSIQVEDFRIEHYPSGQPKSFQSDLAILDSQRAEPLRQTISVNHPLSYKGYTIYQNSFGDGGSQLNFKAWPLRMGQSTLSVQAIVKQPLEIAGHRLELSDFRPFNVKPSPNAEKPFINLGPSFQYKLRKADGTANEFLSYMQPVAQDGRWFYLSGMRGKVAEPFQYWYVPADSEKRLDRFMAFYRLLLDPSSLQRLAEQTAAVAPSGRQVDASERIAVAHFMQRLVEQFLNGGYEQINEHILQTMASEKREAVSQMSLAVLHQLLKHAYDQVLKSEGVVDETLSGFDGQFFEDAVEALSLAHYYDAPIFLELQRFKHVEATGLQITRSPGQWLVFPGCLLLVLGVFCMFYLPQRRMWLMLTTGISGSELLLAGSAQRNRYDFDKEFSLIQQQLAENGIAAE